MSQQKSGRGAWGFVEAHVDVLFREKGGAWGLLRVSSQGPLVTVTLYLAPPSLVRDL